MIGQLRKGLFDRQFKQIKKYKRLVDQINTIEPDIQALTDEELRNKTDEFKERLANGETLDDIKIEAFAVVREASVRTLGLRHFDVQLIGGLVLVEGNIAEMPTGEGKTLVATLPSYLRALEGKGVHIITVNEYLAKRDRELMGQIHEFLGLTVSVNVPQMDPEDKKQAYAADITYGVGTEFGFDYLRDNVASDLSQRVQRPYHYAILDEADSVLIDEAKTPLIMAGKTNVSKDLFYLTAKLVKTFEKEVHYSFDPESKATSLTDEGISFIEQSFGVDNLYDIEHQTLYHYVIQSLRAEIMFDRDVDYIVKDGEIQLVDQFTGRIMEGRSLSNGLHQAIEAKEGLTLTEENKTQAIITIQNFFRKYPIISGMTGTAKTEQEELRKVYGMDVIQIPTNRQKIRIDLEDKVYLTREQKYEALTNEVIERHQYGQPVLIGTTSIQQSEQIAEYLENANLSYQLLNAKSVVQEASLISLAGQKDQITIATNMAGRGTDIMLGEGVADCGGLFVLGTERHESRRVDNQLKGRSGRQGDPGASQFFISLEDDLFKRFAGEEIEHKQKSMKSNEAGLILNKDIMDFVNHVQKICEGNNYQIREYNLKLDDTLSEQREIIYNLRNTILDEGDVFTLIYPMILSSINHIIDRHCPEDSLPEEWPLDQLIPELQRVLPMEITINPSDYESAAMLKDSVKKLYDAFVADIDEKLNNEQNQSHMTRIMLAIIDAQWVNHLEAMDNLKEGIGLRSYGQMDPMVKYQEEGLDIFTETYANIEELISYQLAYFYNQIQNAAIAN